MENWSWLLTASSEILFLYIKDLTIRCEIIRDKVRNNQEASDCVLTGILVLIIKISQATTGSWIMQLYHHNVLFHK